MICKNCGETIPDDVSFCTSCGTNVVPQAPTEPVPAPEAPASAPEKPAQPATVAIPRAYKPLSPWAFYGLSILFHIPILDFILLILFSTKTARNLSLRNYARSHWCRLLVRVIIVALLILLVIVFALVFGFSARDQIAQFIEQLPEYVEYFTKLISRFV